MTGDLARAVDRFGAPSTQPHPTAGSSAAMDLCRLTVVADSVQIDMALPVNVPVALLLPGIVELLDRQPGDAAGTRRQPLVLARVGRPPLPGTRTLDESGVRDGELLLLTDAESPAPTPLFDDLMFTVATRSADRSSFWTPRTAQITGFVVGVVALLLGCVGTVSAAVLGDADGVMLGAASAAPAGAFLVAGALWSRIGRDHRTGVFVSTCAVALAATAGVLFVPPPAGAPHLMLGATAAAVFAILALRLGGRGTAVFTGIAAAMFTGAAAAAVTVFTTLPVTTIGAGTAVVALAALTFAPRMSMMQARLPLPPVPTAGAPLDAHDDDTATYENLDILAEHARSYLAGLVFAGAVAAAAGVLVAALPADAEGGTYWSGTTLALLVALVFLLRGRTFAESNHAIPLVASGAAVILGLLIAATVRFSSLPLASFLVAIAVTVVALTFGSVVPTREYSPVLRRTAELIEYCAIAAIVPVACWVCGLYTAMRAL